MKDAKTTIQNRQAKNKLEIIEQLKKMPIIQVACQRAGIGRTTFYDWCNKDKEFKKATDEAMKEGEDFISDISESQLISLIREKSFSALQLWLRTHHPKYASRLEINGQLTTHEEDELSPEQKAVVRRALRLAGYKKYDGQKQ